MKIAFLFLIFLITINFSYGQISLDRSFINNIDWGYTTRWDIEQLLGKGQYLTKKVIHPSDEHSKEEYRIVHGNGLLYLNSGITFTCYDDGELISGIQFRKPYKGVLGTGDTIIIGETKLGYAFPLIETFDVSTTGASMYWSFKYSLLNFYIEKPESDKDKVIYSECPPFKDKLAYYKNQPISVVTFDLWSNDHYALENQKILNNDLYSIKPLYAPKSETHLNYYKKGWSKDLYWFEIPFYALTGGGKSEKIKEGYWKEFSPKHLIIYEGEFKDGKKNGVFKYYDTEGKLERTERYYAFSWTWIIILFIGLAIIAFIWRRRN